MAYKAVVDAGRQLESYYARILSTLARIEAAREKYADRPAVIEALDALGSVTEMATMRTRAAGYHAALKARVDAMESGDVEV